MPKRRKAVDVGESSIAYPQSSAPLHLRGKGILTPDEVSEWLSIGRKMVFLLPIERHTISPRHIRYREVDVEQYLTKCARPQALGFLIPASIGMNRQDLSIREVSKLLRTRWATAAAFIAPARRISLEALEALIMAAPSSPSES